MAHELENRQSGIQQFFSNLHPQENSHIIALTTAARTPKKLRITARILNTPPRTFGINANTIPKIPNINAIAAKMRPKNTPTLKLKIAARIAMIDATLNEVCF
jgi:hypothetical protein